MIYAVYSAPELAHEDIERVAAERGYARRFDTEAVGIDHSSSGS